MRTFSRETPAGKDKVDFWDDLGGVLATCLLASSQTSSAPRCGCDAHSPSRQRADLTWITAAGLPPPPVTAALREQLDNSCARFSLRARSAIFSRSHSSRLGRELGVLPGDKGLTRGSPGPSCADPVPPQSQRRAMTALAASQPPCRRRLSPPVLPILRASGGSGNSNNPAARATEPPQPRTSAASPPGVDG